MKRHLWHVLPLMFLTAEASALSVIIHRNGTEGVDLVFGPCDGPGMYWVEFSTDLSQSGWQELTRATIRTEGSTRIVSDMTTAKRKFYRIAHEGSQSFHQPDGTLIPAPITCFSGQPFGLQVVFADQCTNGFCEAMLWHAPNDDPCIPSQQAGLNAYSDAYRPRSYVPTGPVAVRLATRGRTPFRNAFGWYNVTGAIPGLADIHPLIDCNANNGVAVVLDIATDPNYLGGAIGFVLITPESHSAPSYCANGNCYASLSRVSAGEGYCYYTDPAFNPDHTGVSSFIHCLTYTSVVTANRFYLTWDDRYGGGDNDFVDMVIVLDGVVPVR